MPIDLSQSTLIVSGTRKIHIGPRHRDVIRLALAGYGNKDIAKKLNMAVRTVKAHLYRTYLALGYHYAPEYLPRMRMMSEYYSGKPNKSQPSNVRLRPRQKELIGLVIQGKKNAVIAKAMGTTELVIKNYMRDLFDTVGVHTREELLLWYYGHQDICKETYDENSPSTLPAHSDIKLVRTGEETTN